MDKIITQEQIKKLKDLYESSKEDLNVVENFIEEHGYLDNGLHDATDSFEQGYHNALWYVLSILDIE